jgi:hypothetical protein
MRCCKPPAREDDVYVGRGEHDPGQS